MSGFHKALTHAYHVWSGHPGPKATRPTHHECHHPDPDAIIVLFEQFQHLMAGIPPKLLETPEVRSATQNADLRPSRCGSASDSLSWKRQGIDFRLSYLEVDRSYLLKLCVEHVSWIWMAWISIKTAQDMDLVQMELCMCSLIQIWWPETD